MDFTELSKDHVNAIVSALKSEANTFKAGALAIDDNGSACLTCQQKKVIAGLPESMREAAELSLLKENKWQEEFFKETMDLAKSIESNKLFIKKDSGRQA